ncbi:hypothetical protein N7492_004551 [Penicillium capsulatum]|uniref:Uncharacterized protein n=1 Tax=Penicillium capsulatum TaxID=69766 RepID=A0A9W9IA52_9EURO|nr:hypothetical protein N7492_004551 [Penicillium capsulatum]KAJ6136331.1 hypothetical protein N7512_001491 [Penicillium capsulatum]
MEFKDKEEHIVVDPDFYDLSNSYQPDDFQSQTESLASKIYRGVIENGRRYQAIREGKYWAPADERQFESLEAGHLVCVVMDSESQNSLFYSPIEDPKRILDIGTGRGSWAVDAADMFPKSVVRGVDLYPPPLDWMPPNCLLEVDDILQEWTWRDPFDLIHLRLGLGSYTLSEWDNLYKQAYDNLEPGGWFEQYEGGCEILCDDGSLPKDSILHVWGSRLYNASAKGGRPVDVIPIMRRGIERAGFVDVHDKSYKFPIGAWPKDPVLKEAGRLNHHMWKVGMDGYAMHLLTNFGDPEPWTHDEVQVYVAKARAELCNPKYHIYHVWRRVWGRKPTEDELAAQAESEGEKSPPPEAYPLSPQSQA